MNKIGSTVANKPPFQQLRLRVICVQPPDPDQYSSEFGLQEKSAGDWVLHQGKRQRNGDIVFDFKCEVKTPLGNAPHDFRGRFIHGKMGERFVYLSWKPLGWNPAELEPGACHWVRRMKVHLRSIRWPQIKSALNKGSLLEAAIAGTGRNGGPNCASVPLARDWTAVDA